MCLSLLACLTLVSCESVPSAPNLPYLTKIIGVSMYPTLQAGEVHMVLPLAYSELRPGMIAVSRTRDSWYDWAHTVVAVYPDYYITKGDHNQKEDGPTSAKDFVGIIKK